MKKLMMAVAGVCLVASLAGAAVRLGSPAPDFTLPASDGHSYKLSSTQGSYVVLEWYNRDCPFIRKHYDSGNMQMLQQRFTKQGVIWFSINSSAPGKEGAMTPSEAAQDRIKNQLHSTATLLDSNGDVGHLYGAKTTPNMFIIDPKGVLIYQGAIDDRPSTDVSDIPGAHNYVVQALTEAMAGKPVSTPQTKPYGCSVKY